MSIDQTLEEFTESLTGFEEIAISKRFGEKDFTDLPGTMAARAMVFAALCREGGSADDAYAEAMGLGLKAVNDFFAQDDEITPDAPTTDSGKDDSLDVEPLKTLLPSVS